MYTILLNNDHELITTQRERIMQRSSMVNKLHFLVPPTYEDLDMTNTTVCMEYLTPGREYNPEVLVRSEELYKDHLEYKLPLTTKLTKEAGDLEIQLTFTAVDMDADGKVIQIIRKTSPTIIKIIPIAAWSDVIPDATLTALDQRMIKLDMMQQQLFDINMALADEMPNTLLVEDGKLHIGRDGEKLVDSQGVDVLLPRVPDTEDGSNDGLIDLDSYEYPPEDTEDENMGNFEEL